MPRRGPADAPRWRAPPLPRDLSADEPRSARRAAGSGAPRPRRARRAPPASAPRWTAVTGGRSSCAGTQDLITKRRQVLVVDVGLVSSPSSQEEPTCPPSSASTRLASSSRCQSEVNRLFTPSGATSAASAGAIGSRALGPAMDLAETEAALRAWGRPPRPRRGGRHDRARGRRPDRSPASARAPARRTARAVHRTRAAPTARFSALAERCPRASTPTRIAASFDRGVLEVTDPEARADRSRAACAISVGGASPRRSRAGEPRQRRRLGTRLSEPRPRVALAARARAARVTPATGAPAPACCAWPTARSARRPSSPWPRRAPCRASSPATSRARLRHGARQHVPPAPRSPARTRRRARRAARVHALGAARSSPTRAASRSSRWATAPSPTRSRAVRPTAPAGAGSVLAIAEEGVTLPLLRRRRRAFMGPETSMAIQAALGLGHRARLRRVHAVQRRPATTRALDRAHPPLARALPALARRARTGGPGRLRHRPGRRPRGPAPRVGAGRRRRGGRRASRSAARSARTRPQMHEVVDWTTRELERARARQPAPPARDRRRRRPHPRRRARDRHVRLRDADAARPSRRRARPRPGQALAPRTSTTRRRGASRRPDPRGLPLPGLRARGFTRGYLPTCSSSASRPACGCSPCTTCTSSRG